MELMSLADGVLPLIRAQSRDLWRYEVANDQGDSMLDGVALLEQALDNPEEMPDLGIAVPTPQETYTVITKAIRSALKVIARADDSSGIIGTACAELLELHPRAAERADVPQLKLADWVFNLPFTDELQIFETDPVAYAPALGSTGMERFKQHVEVLRAEVAKEEPGPYGLRSHKAHVLEWFDKRLAVFDKDPEAIIRTHLRDGNVAGWYVDVSEAFEEIGDIPRTVEWAKQAVLFNYGHQSRDAATRWRRLLIEHLPEEHDDAIRTIFERWPSAVSAAGLHRVDGDEVLGRIHETLEEKNSSELVRFQWKTLKNVQLAWETATRLLPEDDCIWAELAEAYTPIDPVAALRVRSRVVSDALIETDRRKYRPAAREFVKLRKEARATGNAEAIALVDSVIGRMRELYPRRPRLMAEFDQAGLP